MESIMEFMKRDHERLDRLFEDYRAFRRSEPRKAAARFAEFRTGLLRHIGWEEEALFPLLRQDGAAGLGPTAVMRLEHQEIKELLEELQAHVIQRQADTPTEKRLLELLADHNRKEEVVLYPWIDGLLSADQVEDVFLKIRGSAECF